jgi:hypothetical protein
MTNDELLRLVALDLNAAIRIEADAAL